MKQYTIAMKHLSVILIYKIMNMESNTFKVICMN